MDTNDSNCVPTPIERQLAAMVPAAREPNVDQLFIEAGRVAGHRAAMRAYRRTVTSLTVLIAVLTSLLVRQHVTHRHAISAVLNRATRSDIALVDGMATKPSADAFSGRDLHDSMASLALTLRHGESAHSFDHSVASYRNQIANSDDLSQWTSRRESLIGAETTRLPDSAERQSSRFGQFPMKQLWLQRALSGVGDAS